MASKQHLELFFERFLEFNLDRYKDDPTYLAAFTDLTFAEVTIADIVKTDGDTRRSATVTSATRHFKGLNQSWTPAKAATDLKLYTLLNEVPLVDIGKLSEQTVPGLYSYVDGEEVKVAVVIANGVEEEEQDAAVEMVLRAGLVYDIPTVTVNSVGSSVALIGDTFEGTLMWFEGAAEILEIPDTDYGQLEGM